jgi:hypothetical protein
LPAAWKIAAAARDIPAVLDDIEDINMYHHHNYHREAVAAEVAAVTAEGQTTQPPGGAHTTPQLHHCADKIADEAQCTPAM